MVRDKQQLTPEVERLVSQFLKEDGNEKVIVKKNWKNVPVPSIVKVNPILGKLRQVKQKANDNSDTAYVPYKIDRTENASIGTIRKDNFFVEEVTESEQEIIQKRVALQQRQFKEYQGRERTRKAMKITAIYDYLSAEELEEMFDDCKDDEEEVIVRLTQDDYLLGIRKTIATKHAPEVESHKNLMSVEQQAAYEQLLKKRSETLKKTTNDSAKKQYRMGGRLGLDEALKQVQENQVDPEKAFEGWSQARIRAYQMIDQNPNSYYYRFNAPGEVQRKGQWAADERKVFFERLEEVGANGQWGIFAMKVPGRVGYQCSNFYRLLVETNEIQDPNYVVDEKGKAHYLFDKKTADGQVEKTFRTHSKHGGGRAAPSRSTTGRKARASPSSPSTSATEKKPRTAKKKRKSRSWNSDDDDEEDDFEDYNDNSGNFTMSMRTTRRTRARVQESPEEEAQEQEQEDEDEDNVDMDNPLPGFLDPITLEEVVKPAISTYGHVMSYDSWVRCLTNWEGKKNTCPLTKKPLTKRDLVVLTHDNIEEYRDKIKN